MAEQDAYATAEEFVATHHLEIVRVVFTDLHGVLRGKAFPAREYLRHIKRGIRFCESVFALDIFGAGVGATHLTFDSGGGDNIAVPDPTTYCVIPWQHRTGQVFADLFHPNGDFVSLAPRSTLRRVLDVAKALRVYPQVASELEFYVLNATSHEPVVTTARMYGLPDLSTPEAFVTSVLSALQAMQLPVESILQEGGPGQLEINLRYTSALTMADYTVLFKHAVKEIAHRHGLIATFMAKPFTRHSGSGFHLHQSLWDTEVQNNLFAKPSNDGVSQMALHFIAGQLQHLPAAMAFFAPTVNSYKRLRPGRFIPINCTWGYDNRTTAFRVPETTDSGCRIENRVPGADANPYLVIAASIASGLLGIQGHLLPPDPVTGNAHAESSSSGLPRSLAESVASLMADDLFIDAMGRDLARVLTAVKEVEVEQYDQYATDWERDTYLRVV